MRNARIAKKKSVAVNNGHALIALLHEMWQCVAADEICVKGVRGCFPDKVFGGSLRSGNRQKTHQGPLMPSLLQFVSRCLIHEAVPLHGKTRPGRSGEGRILEETTPPSREREQHLESLLNPVTQAQKCSLSTWGRLRSFAEPRRGSR